MYHTTKCSYMYRLCAQVVESQNYILPLYCNHIHAHMKGEFSPKQIQYYSCLTIIHDVLYTYKKNVKNKFQVPVDGKKMHTHPVISIIT